MITAHRLFKQIHRTLWANVFRHCVLWTDFTWLCNTQRFVTVAIESWRLKMDGTKSACRFLGSSRTYGLRNLRVPAEICSGALTIQGGCCFCSCLTTLRLWFRVPLLLFIHGDCEGFNRPYAFEIIWRHVFGHISQQGRWTGMEGFRIVSKPYCFWRYSASQPFKTLYKSI